VFIVVKTLVGFDQAVQAGANRDVSQTGFLRQGLDAESRQKILLKKRQIVPDIWTKWV
jgi:hypothetical protein